MCILHFDFASLGYKERDPLTALGGGSAVNLESEHARSLGEVRDTDGAAAECIQRGE